MQTTTSDKTIRLPDGRQLGYAEYGDLKGMPLLFFHGTPGSRLRLLHIDPLARTLGVRVVAPERPGFGLSDFQPKRTLLDWVHDIEVLTDSLQFGRFAAMGTSSGGPYVAAIAYKLADRVTKAAMISSPGPLTLSGATTDMSLVDRLFFRLARRGPWAVDLIMRSMARGTNQPERLRKQFISRLPPVDASVLQHDEIWDRRLADLREAFRKGTKGASWDIVLSARPWGFQLEEIQVPTFLWHGELDTNAPVALARVMAHTIPNCQATFVSGEGHLSLFLNHEDEIFRSFFTPKEN